MRYFNSHKPFLEAHSSCLLLTVILLTCLVGCSTNALIPSDDMLASHKGDVEGLYRAWISPYAVNGWSIPNNNLEELDETEKTIRGGIERYCKISDGSLNKKINDYESSYVCTNSDGKFLFKFFTTRATNHSFIIRFESALQKS